MRYDKLRKMSRNKAIKKYVEDNPNMSYTEVGQLFGGITRQRVWAILKKERENESIQVSKG
jgi:hypothetical protein